MTAGLRHLSTVVLGIAVATCCACLAPSSADDATPSDEVDAGDEVDGGDDANSSDGSGAPVPRPLYTYGFGGLEELSVDESVALLLANGYAGIAADAKEPASQLRLREYLERSDEEGERFAVVAAYLSHRFDSDQFSDSAHRAAIDLVAGTAGSLWIWFRDDAGTVSAEQLETFVRGIVEYASARGVRTVLYPHHNTIFPTTSAAMVLVRKLDSELFGVAINLTHELRSQRGDQLEETFQEAGDKVFAITISGADASPDMTSLETLGASTVMSLDESEYDLLPYVTLVESSGFAGPMGFLNHQLNDPQDYLRRTRQRWTELCLLVGLHADSGP